MTEADRQPILSHLVELRSRIIRVAIAVIAMSVVAFGFRGQIFEFIAAPYNDSLPADSEFGLVFQGVTEAFSVAMRVSLFAGFIAASPVVFFQAWAFVNPALTKRERRWAIPVVAALVTLFLVGVGFAYWSMPRALEFLLGVQPGVEALITADNYLQFTLRFLLVFGIAFQFPVFLFAAAAAGLVTSDQLKEGRRWAVLVIVVIGAVVTPSGDPLTLLLLSGPLYLFYESTLWLVKLILRK